MNVYDGLFQKTLLDRLDEMIREKAGQLAAGNAQDWVDYRERVAYVRALDHVVQLCHELPLEIQDRKKGAE